MHDKKKINMKKITLLLTILFLISCSNENDCGCVNIETNIDIALKDNNGNYLINTSNYPKNNIQVKYLINGTIQNPKNGEGPIFIDDTNLPTRIRIFLNNTSKEEYPITYVKWNDTDTDTIKSHFIRGNNSIILDKIWINNSLVTNFQEPGRYINLEK